MAKFCQLENLQVFDIVDVACLRKLYLKLAKES